MLVAMVLRVATAWLAVLLALGGCGEDGAPAGDGTYAAYNLFTGAPRFGIFKADAERDLCVRVVFIWAGADGTVALEDALTDVSASVTHRAADCSAGNGGSPPSLEPPGVPAQGATGTATVRRYPEGDTYRWTVSIDGVLSFLVDEAWVPETEPFEADEIEITGGCC